VNEHTSAKGKANLKTNFGRRLSGVKVKQNKVNQCEMESENDVQSEAVQASTSGGASERRRKKWSGRTWAEERAFRSSIKYGVMKHREMMCAKFSLSNMIRGRLSREHPEVKMNLDATIIASDHGLSAQPPHVKELAAMGVCSKITQMKAGITPGVPSLTLIDETMMTAILDMIADEYR
jgi:hypothetical protein